ncbi:MAG TPA: hypothetical protein PK802_07910 [Candidatus Cloacimonadota bacterium]|nr:hypothetical protein [Acidobacteriota bacterium]HNT17054.1 hypothetical protein [Acidobacteriota bacterium]HPB09594.1 hypothetical protein [Candidatus Cloacimonadota bacterium]HQO21082.1 hypothetical protein [Acidobacteriota bacterium]
MKRIKSWLLLCSFLVAGLSAVGEEPSIMILDDGGDSFLSLIAPTSDGGYLVGGQCFTGGYLDLCIAKMDSQLNLLWQRKFGGTRDDFFGDAKQTEDGGFIICGSANSFGDDWGDYDVCVIKLDHLGDCLWQKTYGGGGRDVCNSIIQTNDGGYLIAGGTELNGGGGWLIKLSPAGDIEWQKRFRAVEISWFRSLCQTTESSYLVAGYVYSTKWKNDDGYVIKLDQQGNIIWQKRYGGAENDYFSSVFQTADGHYMVGGNTNSFGKGSADYWLVKLNSQGSIVWEKTYGNEFRDGLGSISGTSDGCVIMAGYIGSKKIAVKGWVLKLNHSGDIVWQKDFHVGRNDETVIHKVVQKNDGSFFIAASTCPENTYCRGAIIAIDNNGDLTSPCSYMENTNTLAGASSSRTRKTKAVGENTSASAADQSFAQGSFPVEKYAICGSAQELRVLAVQSRKDPFALIVFGAGFEDGATATINDQPFPYEIKVNNSNKIILKSGNKIKEFLISGQYNQITIINPDGESDTGVYYYYRR